VQIARAVRSVTVLSKKPPLIATLATAASKSQMAPIPLSIQQKPIVRQGAAALAIVTTRKKRPKRIVTQTKLGAASTKGTAMAEHLSRPRPKNARQKAVSCSILSKKRADVVE
jgi:hypothetical protein